MSSKASTMLETVRTDIQSFEYRVVRGTAGGFVDGDGLLSEEEVQKREQQAWQKGVTDGEARSQGKFEEALQEERGTLETALREFAQHREKYFHKVEDEVIQLSLAIARKVLHRETQLDPLMLSGVVRVALDKVSEATEIKLRVHPSQALVWNRFFKRNDQRDLPLTPEVVPDTTLQRSRCLLETSLGTTDLSLETQLKEVEQGFFDLIAKRPKSE